MKVKIIREIENGVYKASIVVEEITEEEKILFKKYGEPIIDTGGIVERVYIDPPVLTTPEDESSNNNATVTFSWEAVENAISYTLEISLNSSFNNSTTYTVEDTSKELLLENEKTYYWRVSSTDEVGTGEWSEPFSFSTESVIPNVPTLLTPTVSASDQPLDVTMTWTAQEYTLNPITWDIQISEASDFVFIFDSGTDLNQPEFTSSLLENDTTYWWRVRAKNATGSSAYSVSQRFTTIISVPDAPALTSPADGELNAVVAQAFNWEETAQTDYYHFQLSELIDFSSIYIEQENILTTSYTIPSDTELSDGNTYYWRVRSKNSQGFSDWSSIRSLTVNEDLTPEIPVLVAPDDSATNINPNGQMLYWEAADRADEYVSQLSLFADFSVIASEQNPSTPSVEATDMTENTIYYWRIKSVSYSYGESDWSATRSFTTGYILPELPVLNTPSDASTTTLDLVDFSWNLADRATSYDFQLASDTGFSSIISSQTNLDTAFAQYTFTSNATYYWRVRSNNVYGNSAWTSYRSIIVNAVYSLNPSQVSNNNLWLRSDLGITETSDRVSTWADQSAGGGNVTQATSTRRPVIQASAYNGIQSVYFNPNWAGAGETLSYNDPTAKYGFTAANQASLMFTFMSDGTKLDYNSSYFSPFTRSNTSYGQQFAFVRGVNTGPGSNQLGYPFPSGDYTVVPITLNIPHQIIVVKNATNHKIYLDGLLIGEVTKTPISFAVETNSYLNVGSTYHTGDANGKFTGHVFEAAFWTKLLSTTEIAGLYKYFKERYGV